MALPLDSSLISTVVSQMWLKLEAPDIWSAQLTRDAGGSLLSKVLILARPTCKLSICNVELMLAIQIACKSDPTQLLKSLFSDVMITSKWRSCQLHFGVFSAYFFWLFVFKIVKGHHGPEKVCEGHRRHQTIENQFRQAVEVWIDPIFRTIKLRDFSLIITSENQTFR